MNYTPTTVKMVPTQRPLRRFVVLVVLIALYQGTTGLALSSSSKSSLLSKSNNKKKNRSGWQTASPLPCDDDDDDDDDNDNDKQPITSSSSSSCGLSSRRAFLNTASASAAGLFLLTATATPFSSAQAVAAAVVDGATAPTTTTTTSSLSSTTTTTTTTRDDLLAAIASYPEKKKKNEQEILQLIDGLPFTPDAAVDLDGTWELLWSAKAEQFSPLLQLPPPLKPQSLQYLGASAAVEVGEGRLAQGLTGGWLLQHHQLWLSSGVMVDTMDTSMLQILPPFRLQLGGRASSTTQQPQQQQPKWTLVEAGSDADFRRVNARTTAAQQAGANLYQQVYVEKPLHVGSLRVSRVVAGDPVLVGATFVHRKIK